MPILRRDEIDCETLKLALVKQFCLMMQHWMPRDEDMQEISYVTPGGLQFTLTIELQRHG